MEAMLKEILAKLEYLEKEVAEIKIGMQSLLEKQAAPEEISMLEQARRDKPLIQKKFDELFKKWGIDDIKPIGAKKLRELMIADGVNPEDNEFSSRIIAMREE
ncbi:MAG: hypothetical protein O7E52_08510 [Candidatus Poribacteria bacterium]|nr:hypothetical protein [Candidatus Poribacteria bacterium]